MVAAMLLRDARTKGELAAEEGIGAFLTDGTRQAPRVEKGVLRGEISQLRSHNRRCGVEPLPMQTRPSAGDRAKGEANLLELEFLRSAHQLRSGATDPAASTAEPVRKRQRVGANGATVDIQAAQEEEARQADEDAELANPLLRPPPGAAKSSSSRTAKMAQAPPSELGGAPGRSYGATCWPSKGLRVRIVDEHGKFSAKHLKKGVVCRRESMKKLVDVELDGGGGVVRGVPQDNLETVVSKTCTRVEVIRGAHQGLTTTLLSRDPRTNKAVIRIPGVEGDRLELPLDDVCEFT